jgi:Mismatch repair ATPase (MutS family)
MPFLIDKQTLDDLNISAGHNSNLLYNLFNRTVTAKGADMLADMFNHPLTDALSINYRSGIFRFFASKTLDFPLRASSFDIIEEYLNNTDERTRINLEKRSMKQKLSHLISEDNQVRLIKDGLVELIEVVKKMNCFITALNVNAEHPYYKEATAINDILSTPALQNLLQLEDSRRLSQESIDEHDSKIRFQDPTAVARLLNHIYKLDVFIAVARVAAELQFTFAEAVADRAGQIIIEGFRYPLLKGAVPNDLAINENCNVIFLTGANMGGKSTLMKSFSIAVLLAHMGFPVAATKMKFGTLDGIYTTINLPDNLGLGASHFYAEVLRVKKIAKELASGKNLLIVFDELFRGTNVKDACEATISLTAAFAKKRKSIFMISTHIIEAGDPLRRLCSNIAFKYMPTIIHGSTANYTYQLQNGITADRHGMMIIKSEGIFDMLDNGMKGGLV